eukprot:TRINITY_DN47182_c0_g1_i1.p2 TRINITY_DN47182_c0_g1~~TRINITY_DN47182_c0_g1_i1.p2  ORF type:complete len:216 (+),score=73.61 TRINITY_DN47182_c0_g1_i1:142-789(+)
MLRSLVGSEMCIRDRGLMVGPMMIGVGWTEFLREVLWERWTHNAVQDPTDERQLFVWRLAFAAGSTLLVALAILSLNKRAVWMKLLEKDAPDGTLIQDIHGLRATGFHMFAGALAVFNAYCWKALARQTSEFFHGNNDWNQVVSRGTYAVVTTIVFACTAHLSRFRRDNEDDDHDGAEYLKTWHKYCLLYTSDAADEEDSVDLGGRRIIKKKKII